MYVRVHMCASMRVCVCACVCVCVCVCVCKECPYYIKIMSSSLAHTEYAYTHWASIHILCELIICTRAHLYNTINRHSITAVIRNGFYLYHEIINSQFFFSHDEVIKWTTSHISNVQVSL